LLSASFALLSFVRGAASTGFSRSAKLRLVGLCDVPASERVRDAWRRVSLMKKTDEDTNCASWFDKAMVAAMTEHKFLMIPDGTLVMVASVGMQD
jgi:hypothetical protein